MDRILDRRESVDVDGDDSDDGDTGWPAILPISFALDDVEVILLLLDVILGDMGAGDGSERSIFEEEDSPGEEGSGVLFIRLSPSPLLGTGVKGEARDDVM